MGRWLTSLVLVGQALLFARLARRAGARERVASLVTARARVGPAHPAAGRRRRSSRRARREQLARELPVAVELVRMGVGAGLTPADALALVAGVPLSAVRELATDVARRMGGGLSFRESCVRTGAVLGEPGVARLLDLLSDGQRSGAPLGHALGVLAADQRTGLRRRAEERARAVPVKLLFPLVFLALPAFVMLTVAPAVLVALRR
jgi:pilus assembly protein TadC